MVNEEIFMERMYTDIELIDKYQRGMANKEEKAEVQNRLLADNKFRKLFDDLEVMSEGIRRTGARTSVEEKLAQLEATLEDEGETNRSDQPEVDIGEAREESQPEVIVLWYQNTAFRVAASVVLLLAAWFVFYPVNRVNNQDLVAEYFVPYSNTNPKTRGDAIEPKDITAEAFNAYDSKDYKASIPLFEQAVKNGDNYISNNFYLGNAYLAIGESERAVETFKTVIEAESGLTDAAKWFLALAYLYADNTEMTIRTLKNVRDFGEDYYAEKANKLLKELE